MLGVEQGAGRRDGELPGVVGGLLFMWLDVGVRGAASCFESHLVILFFCLPATASLLSCLGLLSLGNGVLEQDLLSDESQQSRPMLGDALELGLT